MRIRDVSAKDLPALAELNAGIFGDTARRQALRVFRDAYAKRVKGASLLAEEDGELAGAVIVEKRLTFTPDAAYIVSFFVGKKWRGRGIGEKLMGRCLAALKKAKIKSVSLSCVEGNKPAISIYQRHGFRPFRVLFLKEL